MTHLNHATLQLDIRHNETVRLISIPERYIRSNDCPIKIGQTGKVLALRAPTGYLVKWKGKSGPVAVDRSDIERVK